MQVGAVAADMQRGWVYPTGEKNVVCRNVKCRERVEGGGSGGGGAAMMGGGEGQEKAREEDEEEEEGGGGGAVGGTEDGKSVMGWGRVG